MSACEPCWGEAYRLSRLHGGSQVDRYLQLLEAGDPHDPVTMPVQNVCPLCGSPAVVRNDGSGSTLHCRAAFVHNFPLDV